MSTYNGAPVVCYFKSFVHEKPQNKPYAMRLPGQNDRFQKGLKNLQVYYKK